MSTINSDYNKIRSKIQRCLFILCRFYPGMRFHQFYFFF